MKRRVVDNLKKVLCVAILAALGLGIIFEYPCCEQNMDLTELRAGFGLNFASPIFITDDKVPTAVPEAVNAAKAAVRVGTDYFIKLAEEQAAIAEAQKKAEEAAKKAEQQAKEAEQKARAAEQANQTLADSLNGSFDGFATEMLRQINAYRTANGVAELKLSSICVQAANVRVVEQATSFSHTRPNGTRFLTVYDDLGYGNIFEIKGENLQKHSDASYDIDTASLVTEAIDNFKLSESHNALMLSSNYEYVGFAVYFPGDGLIFIAQEFGD